jgi:hypothetical protein
LPPTFPRYSIFWISAWQPLSTQTWSNGSPCHRKAADVLFHLLNSRARWRTKYERESAKSAKQDAKNSDEKTGQNTSVQGLFRVFLRDLRAFAFVFSSLRQRVIAHVHLGEPDISRRASGSSAYLRHRLGFH